MIDVKSTIFKTINDTFDKMRMLGLNDRSLLKKIMYLIVLDDIYDWSDYIDDSQQVQNKLQELRTNFILCNPEFTVCQFPFDQHYVNVNTPQTNNTWKRVWDAPYVKIIDNKIEPFIPESTISPWTPDPSCEIKLIYFYTEADQTSKQYLELTYGVHGEKLKTICDKMNIYIDRATGQAWYLDTDCTWKPIGNVEGMTQQQVEALLGEYKINREWIDSEGSNPGKIELTLVKGEANNKIELLTENDVEEMV